VPQEFLFDPITKTYGDPSRRPEVRFGTVEYTATADYMARPPQPAMYLFLLDVSHNAIQTGQNTYKMKVNQQTFVCLNVRILAIVL
jgi:protein transport protein SEC24